MTVEELFENPTLVAEISKLFYCDLAETIGCPKVHLKDVKDIPNCNRNEEECKEADKADCWWRYFYRSRFGNWKYGPEKGFYFGVSGEGHNIRGIQDK